MDRLLITGGSRGIGEAIIKEFQKHDIPAVDISRTSGHDLKYTVDIPSGVYKYVILNAVTYQHKPLAEMSYGEFADTMDINLINQIDIVRELLQMKCIASDGSILTMGSTDIDSLPGQQILYNLAKQGMETFALSLSKEIPQRVNTLHLGFTMTSLCDPSLPIPSKFLMPERVAWVVYNIMISEHFTGQRITLTEEGGFHV